MFSTTMKEIDTFFNDTQMRDVPVLVKKQTFVGPVPWQAVAFLYYHG